MSNLTDLLPAGAGGKQVSFVASGTIGNGVTVALKTDGTVEAIALAAQTVGSPTVFEPASSGYTIPVYDSANNKIVIGYRDQGNSGYGTAIVGTVSGTSISFGTPVVFQSEGIFYITGTYDSANGKVIYAYINSGASSDDTAVVGTVSGTSISFGTPVVFDLASSQSLSATYDSINEKVVIAFRDTNNNQWGTAIVGTVSGTSISFGTKVVFAYVYSNGISATYDSVNGKTVFAYLNDDANNRGDCIIGTVSGNSISFGTATVFESTTNISNIAVTYDSTNERVVVAYKDSGNSNYGTAKVGTVSGTGISFGPKTVFDSSASEFMQATYDFANNKVVIAYRSYSVGSPYGMLVVGTVSGTSITFGSPVVFESSNLASPYGITFDSNQNKMVIAYVDVSNSSYGTAVVFQNQSTNNTDFIGITDAAISNAASGSVTIKGGISTNVTGLTPNATYYVQADGTLSTTASDVLAGKALSSTSINLDYTT